MTQPGTRGRKIPLPCPGAHGHARAGRRALAIAQGRQDPLPMIVQASDGSGRAGRRRWENCPVVVACYTGQARASTGRRSARRQRVLLARIEGSWVRD